MIRLAIATPKQPSDILTTVEGSLPRRACHAQSATMNGVKAKIMNGLNAWNQVTGISRPDQQVDGAVGAGVGPERDGVALLLVGCLKKVVGTNSTRSASTEPFVRSRAAAPVHRFYLRRAATAWRRDEP
jgi:hypothetical protein